MAYPIITLHESNTDDLNNLGFGVLTPIDCTITERAAGYFELEATFPVGGARVDSLRYGRVICAPAPVRESPEITVPSGSGSEVRQIWANRTSQSLWLRSKPAAGVRVCQLASGEECQKLAETTSSGTTFYRVATMAGGAVGYIAAGNLTDTGRTITVQTGTDAPAGSITLQLARRQPFRIYKIEANSGERTVKVYAQHLTYDWNDTVFKPNMPMTSSANFTTFYTTYMQSTSYLTNNLDNLGYYIKDYTNAPFKLNSEHITPALKTPMEIIIGDNGILKQVKGNLIRDGQTLYIVPRTSRAADYVIEYGKNMLTANLTVDVTETVTCIIPYGKNADNTPLYGTAVHASNRYQFSRNGRTRYIEYDVKANSASTEDINAAKAELRAKATADLNGTVGALNRPAYTLDTTFIDLTVVPQYKALANYYNFHLYDRVTVRDSGCGISVTMYLAEYVYDVLKGEYTSIKLEEVPADE